MTQEENRKKKFPDYESRRKVVDTVERTLTRDWPAGMALLDEYALYESEELRRDIYALAWRLGQAQQVPEKRQALADYLTRAMASENDFLHGQIVKFLQDFKPADFSEKAVAVLEALRWEDPHGYDEIKLTGTAAIQSQIPRLKTTAGKNWQQQPPALYDSAQWAAALALVRMGEDSFAKIVVATVLREKDIVMRASRLFYDLGYTKNADAYDTLRRYLSSQALLPSLKETDRGTPEAYFAGDVLTKNADGCPVAAEDFDMAALPAVKKWADSVSAWRYR